MKSGRLPNQSLEIQTQDVDKDKDCLALTGKRSPLF